MRILCFLPELGGGGAQRTLINLAGCFVAGAHDAVLCVANAGGPARTWLSPEVRLIDLVRPRVRGAVLPLVRTIGQLRPEIVLSTGVDANIVAWLATRLGPAPRPRLVLRETNSHVARADIGRLRRFLIGMAYRRAERVVALSNGVRDELIGSYGLDPGRVVTIHNPVKADWIAAAADAARAVAPPWSKKGRAIVSVGRLTRQKGHDRLIAAVTGLGCADVQLVMIGEGEDHADLREQGNKLGLGDRLIMPGWVDDPERWLAHGDVLALTSRWEGFGHVIVEAMAAGVPVVAFDCPHGPRDIIQDGVNGLLVGEGDIQGLVAALRALLDDRVLADRLRQAASAGARRFADAEIADAYLNLFRDVLAEPIA